MSVAVCCILSNKIHSSRWIDSTQQVILCDTTELHRLTNAICNDDTKASSSPPSSSSSCSSSISTKESKESSSIATSHILSRLQSCVLWTYNFKLYDVYEPLMNQLIHNRHLYHKDGYHSNNLQVIINAAAQESLSEIRAWQQPYYCSRSSPSHHVNDTPSSSTKWRESDDHVLVLDTRNCHLREGSGSLLHVRHFDVDCERQDWKPEALMDCFESFDPFLQNTLVVVYLKPFHPSLRRLVDQMIHLNENHQSRLTFGALLSTMTFQEQHEVLIITRRTLHIDGFDRLSINR
jgi:hypothetical protein